MMRVLCVFSLLNRGGAEGMCMNIMRHLDKERVQFDFVKHGERVGVYEEEIKALGGRIYTAPAYKVYNHFQYCAWWKNFLREHAEYKIIHGHYYTLSSIYLKIAKKMGRKTIAHSHNTREFSRFKRHLIKKIEGVADYQFACGEEAGKWMFPHSQFKVICNAIDTDAFKFEPQLRKKMRKELDAEGNLVIGGVGRLVEQKNPLGMVDIVEAASKEIPNLRMFWAGSGSLREEVEKKIEEKGLNGVITLLGNRGDVPALMQAMDAVLMPSLFEGLPVSLVEAQASGLPILCSDTITKEVDVTGLCSFLPLDDTKAWVDAIKAIDTSKRTDISDLIIKSGYDVRATTKWLEQFYCSL